MNGGDANEAQSGRDERLLVEQAIRGAIEELQEIEHSLSVWAQRSRTILQELSGLLPDAPSSTLSSTLSKLKQGDELDKLLQGIAAFPAALDHYVHNIAPSQELDGGAERLEVADSAKEDEDGGGEEKKGYLQIRRTQNISGARVVTEFVRYYCEVQRGELVLRHGEGRESGEEERVPLCAYAALHAPDEALPEHNPGLREWKLALVGGGGGGGARALLASLGATVSYLGTWSTSAPGPAPPPLPLELALRAETEAAARAWRAALLPCCAAPPANPSPSLFSLSFKSPAPPSDLLLSDPERAPELCAAAAEAAAPLDPADPAELDSWGVLRALAAQPARHTPQLTARLAALAHEQPALLEFLLPQITNLAMEGEDVSEVERFLFQMCTENVHVASLLAWILRSSMGGKVAAEAHQPSLLSRATGLGAKGDGGRERLLEVYSRIMLGVELAVVDGKRLGSTENAGDFIARASTQLCQGEKRLRTLYSDLSAAGDDTGDLGDLGGGGAAAGAWERVQLTRSKRRDFFFKQHSVVEELCELSSTLRLVPKGAGRDQRLRERLREINAGLPSGVYVPLCHSGEQQLAICRVPEDEALCLSTYDKTPYVIHVEAITLKHAVADTHCVVHSPALLRHSLHAHGIQLQDPVASAAQADIEHEELELAPTDDTGEEMKELCPKGDEGVCTESEATDSAMRDVEDAETDQGDATQSGDKEDAKLESFAGETEVKGERLLEKVFGETWEQRQRRIRERSPYGKHPDWRLMGIIVKADDDIRQEQFAMQLIREIERIWKEGNLPLRLRTYSILSTAPSAGLIEMIPDVISIATLRRRHDKYSSLANFFQDAYGPPESQKFQDAQQNFVCSMAAYSIVTYVLQIKDRHDGNILLEREGGIAHIDFGFMLGRRMNEMVEFEKAPFKLTQDHVDVMMLGAHGACYQQFLALCIKGYLLLRNNSDRILTLVKAMQAGSPLPCLEGGQKTLSELEDRLGLAKTEGECVDAFIQLRDTSLQCWRTGAYDMLQKVLGVY